MMANKTTFRYEGFETFLKKMQKMDKIVKKTTQDSLKEVVESKLLPRIVENTPKRTGRLRRGFRVTVDNDKTVMLSNSVPYAAKVHETTWARHKIQPTSEGGVGAKYITRVVNARSKEILAWFAETFKKRFSHDISQS